ncbi:TIGR04255 family protein [Deinococcus knuensis]|uniref:TIGR04255 family protein n=1 Tax=Deinococcus knuensis TaxID=1837380 RepID=A0ABQ2SMP8_9DEIO|nr:TIGR04255 family protein [Deinococcus knuensis]GGS34537.1 hypothetical protein GCM10008961_27860 [Deinococcus knuensis]
MASTQNIHPKLKDPRVYEVVFGISFESEQKMLSWAPILQNSLKDLYPRQQTRLNQEIQDLIETQAGSLSLTDAIETVDEHFYRSINENGDIISFGPKSLFYIRKSNSWGWESIQEDLLKVISLFYSSLPDLRCRSTSLTYKNIFNWQEGDEKSIISEWLLPNSGFDPSLGELLISHIRRTIANEDLYIDVGVVFPYIMEDDSEKLYLEIEANQDYEMNNESGNPVKFLESAHDRIYDIFLSCVKSEYRQEV